MKISKGQASPLGARIQGSAVNFAVCSSEATAAYLELFDEANSKKAREQIPMQQTGHVWHVCIDGIGIGQHYAYRLEGTWAPKQGLRFNQHKILIDPYTLGLSGEFKWHDPSMKNHDMDSQLDHDQSKLDNTHAIAKNIVLDNKFDWGNDISPQIPWNQMTIYEVHLKGFTRHISSQCKNPGTYLGFIEKIPYLKTLGITSVELLPIFEFDTFQHSNNPQSPPIENYWGYNTIAFFAPKRSYSSDGTAQTAITEFKQLVKELHKNDMEIILDVVFNHTVESDELGPSLSFKGLDNRTYYMLEDNSEAYRNYSGCGNTVSCNHEIVMNFIMDCLNYWVDEMHVDGFRFDLAAIFQRDEHGNVLDQAPIIEQINTWAEQKKVKVIAEAWDAAGLYSLGQFPTPWAEWNGQYRDTMRMFWLGYEGTMKHFATRFMGSRDIFNGNRNPLHSVNFITAHDGFTLKDLVSYNHKHNEANGENNRDGESHNHSCNWGEEGETENPAILNQRERMLRNYLCTLFLSHGIPMILGGDEMARTQHGNNNAYCQDSPLSWFDWDQSKYKSSLYKYVKNLIEFRKTYPCFYDPNIVTDPNWTIHWYREDLNTPDWDNPIVKSVAIHIFHHSQQDQNFFMVFNAAANQFEQNLPCMDRGTWIKMLDTSFNNHDACSLNGEPLELHNAQSFTILAHSVIVLKYQTT